jgi:hypothetical protein
MVAAGSVELGSGAFCYEAPAAWEQLPAGMTLAECAGVAVDEDGLVYLLTRNVDNPVVVLDADGGVVRSFGAGVFTSRTHPRGAASPRGAAVTGRCGPSCRRSRAPTPGGATGERGRRCASGGGT